MRNSKPQLLQLNPIIVNEIRAHMRGIRPYAILSFFLVVLITVGYGIYALMINQSRFGTTILSAQIGQALFTGLTFCALLMVVFLAPTMTSGSISSERERLTYDMLMATPLPPTHILWGKLIAALLYLFMLFFTAIPVFSVIFMFGGIAPQIMVQTFILLIVITITYGTIGLCCSSLFQRTAPATMMSYAIIFLLISGTSITGAVWGQFSQLPQHQVPPQLLYLNPFSALLSILVIPSVIDTGTLFNIKGGFLENLPLLYILTPGVIYYGPNGTTTVPLFRATLMFYPLITLILYWLSVHLVRPRDRWTLGWSDLGFALIIIGALALIGLTRSWWFVPPPFIP